MAVLEFDHVGDDKSANVGALIANGHALKRVIAEAEKCEVVCANCHRRRTARRAGWLRASATWRLELEARATTAARNQLVALEHLAEHGCVDCGTTDIVTLDFDHIGPKRRGVMALASSGVSVATLVAEIANCEVRCACCHRRVTIARADQYRARLGELQPAPADDPQHRREEARRLRRTGGTVTEIAATVGADPKTVSRWVRDLPLTDEQQVASRQRVRRRRAAEERSDPVP